MVIIEVNNNKCRLDGKLRECNKLYEAFKVRHPNAFWVRQYMPKGWDGKIDYITNQGYFSTGLLGQVLKKCEELGINVELDDLREDGLIPNLVTDLNGALLRGYQKDAVLSIITNKVLDMLYPRGTIKAATNAGKTIISAGIHAAYDRKTIFLMNSKELFDQALDEIPRFLPGQVGFIGNGKAQWNNFMVCMVKTLLNNLSAYKNKLSEYEVLIVDECDLSDNKTNKKVIQFLHTAIVRVGLSGTVNVRKLKKDQVRNWNIEGYFGPQVFDISNRTLIDLGHSSEVQVKFVRGNMNTEHLPTFRDEYTTYIVKNKKRNKKILKRCIYHYNKGRKSQLVIVKEHAHIKNLLKLFNNAEELKGLTIEWVHHQRKDRKEIVDKFKNGEVDILIGSLILKRGKNFPLMKYMINASGGLSPENPLQLLGRAFRGAKHYEDMWDEGRYLKRHSKRRYIYYRDEKITVINKYVTKTKKTTKRT